MSDDQQRTAEAIDPDELGDDPEGDLEFPPERPLGLSDAAGLDGEMDSVEDRQRREQRGPDDQEDGMRLTSSTDLLADDEADLVGGSASAEDLSAEEAAVHLTADPTFREDDSYLER